MKVIASGRASEIFDLEDGRVLRRFKVGGDPDREALVMRNAADHGYPVPRVLEVTADALVLERVDGPTMLADLRRRPWRLSRHAALLAELHKRLHEIVAPQGVPNTGKGDRLLHLDLHPDNVLLSPEGPVVIDWTNARRGDPALDVALTWVIAATSGGRQGRVFLQRFLPHFDREAVLEALPAAAERRIADPNVTEDEREAVRRLVERHARR
jgi:aminoglycoside phosphotransferase (APT) family kinase protein